MKNKKNIMYGLLLGILLLIIICIVAFGLRNKTFNVEKVEKDFTDSYSYYRVFDEYDLTNYFGIIAQEIDSYVVLGDYYDDPEEPKPFTPNELIVVINDKDPIDYYEIMRGFLDSYMLNEEDAKKMKLYENAILKKGNRYTYLIFGTKVKEKEKKLLQYLR